MNSIVLFEPPGTRARRLTTLANCQRANRQAHSRHNRPLSDRRLFAIQGGGGFFGRPAIRSRSGRLWALRISARSLPCVGPCWG